jgi:HD-GYP domain-containing protein (c-di-GMP phosphodiesterase class II)
LSCQFSRQQEVKPMQQRTQGNIEKKEKVTESLFWVSLILGVLFWIIDAILTVIISTDFSFLQTLIGIDSRDIWQRLIVICFLVIFASHVQHVTRKRHEAEEKLQMTLERLKRAAGSTIHVLVSALEVRDPYTAGHQARSANLACAIAAEMGLSEDKIEGIRMAGVIHDIGKLSVPVEILTKPKKLTDLEYSLIKEHSHSGFEMLKDLESVWPLAEIVHQHHERMNGSGYPKKLQGDEILIEARILAVADVVEAISSHRPYRPAFDIKEALNEIEKNRGILYDAGATDACLRLFQKKGYKLPLNIDANLKLSF